MAPRSRNSLRNSTAKRRDETISVACALFARNGFAGTNIREICSATRLSVGTLYHHFGSKEALLATTYLTVLNRYMTGALPLLDSTSPAEVVIKETVFYHLSWLVDHPTEARFLLQFIGGDPHIEAAPSELVRENEDWLAAVKAWVETAMSSGQIKRIPFRSVVALLIGPMYQWVRDWLLEQEPVDLVLEAEILADGSWAALRGA
jgi:AcrR family transcriptional regulator